MHSIETMKKYSEQMKQAKEDVKGCLDIWTELLVEKFQGEIEYMYAKGSATKPWETFIDYVPILSDVDIHIKLKENVEFLSDESSIYSAVQLPEIYENQFTDNFPSHLHIPRVQIVNISHLLESEDFVLPREQDVTPLFGIPSFKRHHSTESIRKIDLQGLNELQEFLSTFPPSMLDKTGLELWTMIRRLNWRISPAPVRLLSQLYEDPLLVWGLNRTQIVEELNKRKFDKIAEKYIKFYTIGWIAFEEGFLKPKTLRKLILTGFKVLQLCVKRINQ